MPAGGKPTLQVIVDAAMTIADENGLDAVTIRAVAKLVGMPPMSLYTHFSTKDELLNLMYRELTRRFFDGERRPTWQAELLALAERSRRVLLRHPHWMALLGRPTV